MERIIFTCQPLSKEFSGGYSNIYLVKKDNGIFVYKRPKTPYGYKYMIETYILHNFSHPNIMHSAVSFEDLDRIYVYRNFKLERILSSGHILPHMESDLFDIIDHHLEILTLAQKKYLIRSIGEGIKYFHNRNFVHGDLKPENILIDDIVKFITADNCSFKVVITDFDTAMQFKDDKDYAEYTDHIGTFQFLSPEVLLKYTNKPFIRHKSDDIWAYAIMCYQILAPKTELIFADIQYDTKCTIEYLDNIVNWLIKFKNKQNSKIYNQDSYQFLSDIIKLEYKDRPTIEDILNHEYLKI